MDEREIAKRDMDPSVQGQNPSGRKKGKGWIMGLALAAVLALGTAGYMAVRYLPERGYQDYTIQKQQYFVEYSEQYDYWDVLTVEYPVLSGVEEEVQGRLNEAMYEAAMDRVNYWHLAPNDAVKAFQEENFSIFCSDVTCDVTYHSPYLISMDFYEIYSAGNPVWMTNITERALTADLITGQTYALSDILEINSGFTELWDKSYSERIDEQAGDEEDIEILLSWFRQEDQELQDRFESRPFFFLRQEGDFVIGLSLDPVLYEAVTYEPTSRILWTVLGQEELEPYKTESEFWSRYQSSERSGQTGEVLPCEDKKENLWLGEGAGIWQRDY